MAEMNMQDGFVILDDLPQSSPLEELETTVDKLDAYREQLQQWRDQERSLCDHKLYVRSDDTFHEGELITQTRKCYFVQLSCGTAHCLPSRLFDDFGPYTRRTGAVVHAYWQGWRARQDQLSLIEQTERRYARLTSDVIPGLVRSVRQSKGSVPHGLVQRLTSHYDTAKRSTTN